MEINALEIGDKVQLKKPHPSKTKEWLVLKVKPVVKLKSTQYPNLFVELKRDKAKLAIKNIIKKDENNEENIK